MVKILIFKSEEKRIKIKRELNREDNNDKGQLNHSFDNTLNTLNTNDDFYYNSFEYTYQFKSQSKINLDSNSKFERSYFNSDCF